MCEIVDFIILFAAINEASGEENLDYKLGLCVSKIREFF